MCLNVSHMSEMIHTRVRPAERKLYETAAALEQRRLADWVRVTLFRAAKDALGRYDEDMFAAVVKEAEAAIVR